MTTIIEKAAKINSVDDDDVVCSAFSAAGSKSSVENEKEIIEVHHGKLFWNR